MAVFSSLRRCYFNKNLFSSFLKPCSKNINGSCIRYMSEHRILPLAPSRFQYNKFKDLLHFYVMIGAIPIAALVMFTNIFIGPATLSEIPEGYTPKHWEYYRHPITRFIARYMINSPQQEYEKYLHFLYENDECAKIRLLETKIKALMKDRADYQAWYYIPYTNTNYLRIDRERGNLIKDEMYGTND